MITLFLLVAPLLLIASLAGYGAALSAMLAGRRQTLPFFEAAFAGLFLVTLVVLAANFFVGIGTIPGPYVLATGLALFAAFQGRGGFRLSPLALLAAFAASAAFLVRSNSQLPFDTGVYYLSAMNWTAHQPLALGLANLEARLGFDSAWLLFVSALRSGSSFGWTHLVVAEIALRALVIGWLVQALQDDSVKGRNASARLLLVALPVLSVYLLGRFPSPTTTDLPANLVAFCAWIVFCRLMLAEDEGTDGARFSLLLLLVMLAITFKLAMAPIALLPVFLLVRQGRAGRFWRGQAGLLCLIALYGFLWLGRNFILSGCLAFPVGVTCFPVSWGAGRIAGPMAAVIRNWARVPGSLPGQGALFDMAWLPAWLVDFAHAPELWLVLGAALLALVLAIFGRHRGQADQPAARALAGPSLLCVVAGLLFWFFTAPNPRFSWCFFVMLGITLLFRTPFDLGSWTSIRPSITVRRAVLYGVAIFAAAMAIQLARGAGPIEAPLIASRTVTVPPHWPLFMPASGDQCWALFPCAPYGLGDTSVEAWHGRLLFRANIAEAHS